MAVAMIQDVDKNWSPSGANDGTDALISVRKHLISMSQGLWSISTVVRDEVHDRSAMDYDMDITLRRLCKCGIAIEDKLLASFHMRLARKGGVQEPGI